MVIITIVTLFKDSVQTMVHTKFCHPKANFCLEKTLTAASECLSLAFKDIDLRKWKHDLAIEYIL